jgi:hypothetical protein
MPLLNFKRKLKRRRGLSWSNRQRKKKDWQRQKSFQGSREIMFLKKTQRREPLSWIRKVRTQLVLILTFMFRSKKSSNSYLKSMTLRQLFLKNQKGMKERSLLLFKINQL